MALCGREIEREARRVLRCMDGRALERRGGLLCLPHHCVKKSLRGRSGCPNRGAVAAAFNGDSAR